MAPRSERLVRFSAAARADIAEIYEYTLHYWGPEQAERYSDMLFAECLTAAENPDTGRPIRDFPTLRARYCRWKAARHGHNIVYETDDMQILVLRILHSARSLPDSMSAD